jgi:putative transposase
VLPQAASGTIGASYSARQALEAATEASRAARRALPRPQAHLRDASPDEGSPPEDSERDARALECVDYAGHLQPPDTGTRASRGKLVAGYTRFESGVKSPRMPQLTETAMPGPLPPSITLTDRQRKMLVHLTRRATTTQRLARRARIVLAAADGANNEQIARELGLNRETARLWRRAWLEGTQRLRAAQEEAGERTLRRCIEEEVLADRPRSGAPPTFTPEQVCQIVALACEAPSLEESGRPVTHWSLRELADEAIKRGIVEDISPRSVGSFLKGGGPKAPPDALLDEQRARQRA